MYKQPSDTRSFDFSCGESRNPTCWYLMAILSLLPSQLFRSGLEMKGEFVVALVVIQAAVQCMCNTFICSTGGLAV